jgi:DNA-binding response OmpR family regulator
MHQTLARHQIALLDPAPGALGWLITALARLGHHPVRIDRLEELPGDVPGEGARMAAALLVARVPGPPPAAREVLRRVRQAPILPCILVGGAADTLADRVAALGLGAADYLHGGMAQQEMLARVEAVLRRLGEAAVSPGFSCESDAGAPLLLAGGWQFWPQRRTLVPTAGGPSIRLTGAEFALLHLLAMAGGETLGRDAISRAVFRRPWRVEDRAVDGLVKRLRRKLGPAAIGSMRGIGYALLDPGAPVADKVEI